MVVTQARHAPRLSSSSVKNRPYSGGRTGLAGLDKNHAFAALAHAATDNVHVDAGSWAASRMVVPRGASILR